MSESRAKQHVLAGEFRKAADCLKDGAFNSHSDNILRAQIELEVGDTRLALSRAEALLRERLDSKGRANCLSIAGRALGRLGAVQDGVGNQRKGIALAAKIGDAPLESELSARLAAGLLDWIGIEPALVELPRLRRIALSAANTCALIDYHILTARIAAMRGWLPRAGEEARIAFNLLQGSPNKIQLWKVRQIQSNVAIKACDMSSALNYALDCLDLAESSGSMLSIGTTLGNLAHIAAATGDFERGRQFLRRAMASLDASSHMRIAAYSTGLEIGLACADAEFANEMVANRDGFEEPDSKDSRYYHLWFELNRVRWLASSDQLVEAESRANIALEAITKLADSELFQRMALLAVECRARLGDVDTAARLFGRVIMNLDDSGLETVAETNRVAGVLVEATGNDDPSAYLGRAWRILTESGLRGGCEGLRRTLHSLRPEAPMSDRSFESTDPALDLQSCANLLLLGRQPRVLVSEVSKMLERSGLCALIVVEEHLGSDWKRIEALGLRGTESLTNDCGKPVLDGPDIETLELGSGSGNRFRLRIAPKAKIQFRLLWAAICRIAKTAEAAANYRESQQHIVALWPDETPEQQLGMVVAADNMLQLLNATRRVASSTITVLFVGETGTGKELLARALHDASPRKDKPFIPFNCTAFPREMLDAQLFGYRRGAFTGAQEAFQGSIRAAHGGTLFLDEIGEMTLDVQPKLLRFLESSEIHPARRAAAASSSTSASSPPPMRTSSSSWPRASSGRICSTGLNVVQLDVPPVRERREEIPQLVQHYLERCSREMHKTGLRFAEETMEYLILYKWPGNVRQLANEVRRLVAFAESGAVLMPEHLSSDIASSRRTIPASERDLAPTEFVVRTDQPMAAAIEHVERALIQYAFKHAGGMDEAAQLLGPVAQRPVSQAAAAGPGDRRAGARARACQKNSIKRLSAARGASAAASTTEVQSKTRRRARARL